MVRCYNFFFFKWPFWPKTRELKLWKIKQQSLSETSELTTITDKLNTETSSSSLPPESAASTSSLTEQPSSQKEVSCFSNVFRPPDKGEDYTILQALFSIDMFVLFFATICGIGGTLRVVDNLGQIGTSLGYPQKSMSTFISLVSTWNYLGSVTAGFGLEIVLDKYKFPRPLILTHPPPLMCWSSPHRLQHQGWSLLGINNYRLLLRCSMANTLRQSFLKFLALNTTPHCTILAQSLAQWVPIYTMCWWPDVYKIKRQKRKWQLGGSKGVLVRTWTAQG